MAKKRIKISSKVSCSRLVGTIFFFFLIFLPSSCAKKAYIIIEYHLFADLYNRKYAALYPSYANTTKYVYYFELLFLYLKHQIHTINKKFHNPKDLRKTKRPRQKQRGHVLCGIKMIVCAVNASRPKWTVGCDERTTMNSRHVLSLISTYT